MRCNYVAPSLQNLNGLSWLSWLASCKGMGCLVAVCSTSMPREALPGAKFHRWPGCRTPGSASSSIVPSAPVCSMLNELRQIPSDRQGRWASVELRNSRLDRIQLAPYFLQLAWSMLDPNPHLEILRRKNTPLARPNCSLFHAATYTRTFRRGQGLEEEHLQSSGPGWNETGWNTAKPRQELHQ